ncbi:hypothetical protein [Sphingomicrobium astaxanthinifaciens]|uniref:hypothetical protein n=1 Tax=Sphingomicrobium astaxanthinifaciens TaxID=1227949 RepID=UPI001FCC2A6D|nr:hypothetical protein [Sphingomicrobium astaxanthinifaciens]MCJ7421463.1 hypothetical protein [Sphingomicrobium astaxanthinifaciens]
MKTTAASLVAGSLAFVLTRAIRAALAADGAPARFADAEESPHVRAARGIA